MAHTNDIISTETSQIVYGDKLNGNGAHHPRTGLTIERVWVKAGEDPYDQVQWNKRTALIKDAEGNEVFRQDDVEAPTFWSDQAVNIVASKYFRGHLGTPERETSVRQLIARVVDTIAMWGSDQGYFAMVQDAAAFNDELSYLILNQAGTFNSPVWFNVGVKEHPECSACFLNSVEDSLESITELLATEARLFKGGSGSGVNLSNLRAAGEPLSIGGYSSGPLSFMRALDVSAGAIKSGGTTRRAACARILDVDHPDILEFIQCKAAEEKKAWALIEAGYDGGFNVPGGAYDSVLFQNANHSVRVTDEFMQKAKHDEAWVTIRRTDRAAAKSYRARYLLHEIAAATHLCGDPGLLFADTVDHWNTCKQTGAITETNPCFEVHVPSDVACNLANLNLMAFWCPDGAFAIEEFIHACEILITAQEIIVDNARYPTERIEQRTREFRPLGLGYSNLGAFLMASGLPYDSEEGRSWAAGITALMTGTAYTQSAKIARSKGPFRAYSENSKCMLDVIEQHQAALDTLGVSPDSSLADVIYAADFAWRTALDFGMNFGYRNSQVTVLMPGGTTSFMMDCQTTGLEPELALVKYKTLVGGGSMKITNNLVGKALEYLNYTGEQIEQIGSHVQEKGTVEGAPFLIEEHLPIFDCSFAPFGSTRVIEPMGHLKMVAAVQPFLSGSSSKTINCPEQTTVEEIEQMYLDAWKMGIKCVAIYRDGSKRTQPLSTTEGKKESPQEGREKPVEAPLPPEVEKEPRRRRLPDERPSITHKMSIAGHEGYLTVGLFEDGTPGEIFVRMSKEGSTIAGLMDSFATAISLCLQYGVPLEALVSKFSFSRFSPSGFTGNKEIPIAHSIVDYIARWLSQRFAAPIDPFEQSPPLGALSSVEVQMSDAPPCGGCGSIMTRAGACYRCLNCGSSSGCG